MKILRLNSENNYLTNKWPAILILLIFSFFIITGGILFYVAQKNRTVKNEENELNAVISLKVEELTKWRSEHLRDLKILADNVALKNMILDYLQGTGSSDALKNTFLPMTEDYDYKSIFIVDRNRIVRFSTSEKELDQVEQAENISSGSYLDLQFDRDSTGIFMDMVISLQDSDGKPAGALILRIDPETVLFPMIQSWPGPSKTSETLLLRKEGDSIVFLNKLRHVNNTALKMKLPASDSDLPAAKVVKGYNGFFEGIDYRDVPVFSYLRKVPDSPWYMVAKVDKAEIYSPLNEQIILITIITVLSIVTFIIITVIYFRNQRIKYLSEISNVRDKLYSIITHDLKNPFVSIMGYSELLYEKSLKDDFSRIKEFTSIIYNSSTNAIGLLNNLTSWTKLQTGRTLFNPDEADIVPLINDATDSCRSAASMKSISFRVSTPPELITAVDSVMFSTILRNLLMNAVKFSSHHSDVKISAMKHDSIVEVAVEDTGIGMDKQTAEKILNMGKYESTPGTDHEKGTGLGLFLCMEFISMHKGTLNIESEPGSGSRFTVKLPCSYTAGVNEESS